MNSQATTGSPADRAGQGGMPPAPADAATAVLPAPLRMHRRRTGRIVAGVAGGLAEHLGISVLWVRVTFTVLVGLAGAGVLAYGLLWVLVPQYPLGSEPQDDTPKQRQQAIGIIALGFAGALALSMWSGSLSGWVVGPLGVALAGAAVVWREADEAQRRRWKDATREGVLGTGRMTWLRVGAGISVAAIGIGLFLASNVGLNAGQFVLLAIVTTLLGVGVLTVPWWLRLVRDLNEERRARIRTEERAEIAAHLHDSVLQTLALILKQADNSREVRRLARGQERQLRAWLYGPSGYGGGKAASGLEEAPAHGVEGDTLAEAIAIACGQVEDTFAIRVQQVVVGDCPLDDRMAALVQAAREAAVNAAKHAGVGEVSVYAEVEPDGVHVFVRDRGAGFDPDEVPADRHGLADSIHGRMERNAGKVRVRTAPGEGTEIQLEMPRAGKEART